MTRLNYPWLALGTGVLLALVLLSFGALQPDAENSLPLLTLLLTTEFAFFLTAIAAGLCVNRLLQSGFQSATAFLLAGNLLMAGGFMWLGLELWPYAAGPN